MKGINGAVVKVLKAVIEKLESGETQAHSIGTTMDFSPDFVEFHPLGSKPSIKSKGGTVTTEMRLLLTHKE